VRGDGLYVAPADRVGERDDVGVFPLVVGVPEMTAGAQAIRGLRAGHRVQRTRLRPSPHRLAVRGAGEPFANEAVVISAPRSRDAPESSSPTVSGSRPDVTRARGGSRGDVDVRGHLDAELRWVESP